MSIEHKDFPHGDPRLDWRMAHDQRSENYPIRACLPRMMEIKPRMWKTGPVLDQGREGACVGFGWTGELMASPKPLHPTTMVANSYARGVYHAARKIDEWPGEAYEGTSVLAGAKIVQERGYISEYRWAFTIEDVRDAVIQEGPVVIGIPWYEDMYGTTDTGIAKVGGRLVGGHCILVTGYHPNMRVRGEDWRCRFNVFRWRNSWGEDYGVGGSALVRYEELRDLLSGWGEACVPVNRQRVRLPR